MDPDDKMIENFEEEVLNGSEVIIYWKSKKTGKIQWTTELCTKRKRDFYYFAWNDIIAFERGRMAVHFERAKEE